MENNVTAGNLTQQQIEESVAEILRPIKDNSLPQLRLQNHGQYLPLTAEEIDFACSSMYEDL